MKIPSRYPILVLAIVSFCAPVVGCQGSEQQSGEKKFAPPVPMEEASFLNSSTSQRGMKQSGQLRTR